MAIKEFKLIKNSEQHKFIESHTPFAGYTGGYGNGKTASLGVIALLVATNYENARILVGRATRPKLEDSTKPELLKWTPSSMIERWPSDRNNNLVFKETGSRIEFRHIRQEGKGKGEEQSNLLSATYDLVVVDQIDDPEFSYKDFTDLIGRLRGTAKYIGNDPTMPRFGPQWFRFGANPTRNWLFRELVNPYLVYKRTGITTPKLLRLDESKPVSEENPSLLEIFNAPSAANSHNTGGQYVNRMKAVMRGSQKKRYVDGDWSAYEGLVYPEYDELKHIIQEAEVEQFVRSGLARGDLGVLESYDYGQSSPSCYLLAFFNSVGDVIVADGFYGAQLKVKQQADKIKAIRNKWSIIPTTAIYADPDLFRKKHGAKDKVGESIADMFSEEDIEFQRGANDIDAGIAKVSSYLAIDELHRHPVTRNYGSARLLFSSNLDFIQNEIVDYYWNRNIAGENVDKPRDRNDHAMDAIKYLLTSRNRVVGNMHRRRLGLDPSIYAWQEMPSNQDRELLPRHR